MDEKLKEKLQNIVEKAQNDTFIKEKPSFASVVFCYKVLANAMNDYIKDIKVENVEYFLTEEAPISRVEYPLIKLGIISNYGEKYPYWINYVGDLIADKLIQEAKTELEWMKNH